MKTVLLIQGGGCARQTKKLRGELCCQREKKVEEKTEQPERESSRTAKGNFLFYYYYFFFIFMDLRIRRLIFGDYSYRLWNLCG